MKTVAAIEDRMRFFFIVSDGQGPVFVFVYTRCTFYPSFCIFHSMIQSSSFVSHWCNYWWTSFLLFVLLSHHQRRWEKSFALFFFGDSIAKPWYVRIILGVDIIFPWRKKEEKTSAYSASFRFIAWIRIMHPVMTIYRRPCPVDVALIRLLIRSIDQTSDWFLYEK